LLPQVYGRAGNDEEQVSNRLAEAFSTSQTDDEKQQPEQDQEVEIDSTFTVSERELLQHADFETMTNEELAQAKKMIAALRLPIPEVRTRRLAPDQRGQLLDARATLRASLRSGGDLIPLRKRSQQKRHPPLVVLCDISGSMSRYSRMFLHFLHALTNDRDRVHCFVFGTRLTNVTRALRHRDVDLAMDRVSELVADWSGGTRIGASMREFNMRWGRRVLGQNAVLLLISDGLDREAGEGLSQEMARLHRSTNQLVWLNPLLRYSSFEAKPAGVKAMLPHVDAFLPVHNIASLVELGRILGTLKRTGMPLAA